MADCAGFGPELVTRSTTLKKRPCALDREKARRLMEVLHACNARHGRSTVLAGRRRHRAPAKGMDHETRRAGPRSLQSLSDQHDLIRSPQFIEAQEQLTQNSRAASMELRCGQGRVPLGQGLLRRIIQNQPPTGLEHVHRLRLIRPGKSGIAKLIRCVLGEANKN